MACFEGVCADSRTALEVETFLDARLGCDGSCGLLGAILARSQCEDEILDHQASEFRTDARLFRYGRTIRESQL